MCRAARFFRQRPPCRASSGENCGLFQRKMNAVTLADVLAAFARRWRISRLLRLSVDKLSHPAEGRRWIAKYLKCGDSGAVNGANQRADERNAQQHGMKRWRLLPRFNQSQKPTATIKPSLIMSGRYVATCRSDLKESCTQRQLLLHMHELFGNFGHTAVRRIITTTIATVVSMQG